MTTPHRQTALLLLPDMFHSAPRHQAQPVTSAAVDGIPGPVADSRSRYDSAPVGTVAMSAPQRPTANTAVTALLAALVALLCSACSASGPLTQEDTMDPQAELAARPTLDEMVVRYDQMLQRIRDRLDIELGPFTWYEARQPTWSTCGRDFPSDLGGRTTSSPSWAFEGNIPDDQWPHAQRVVADITAEYGFVTAGLQIDTPATHSKPGHHVTGGVDTTFDAYYDFGTNVNTSIRVSSGCHLATNFATTAPSTGTRATP
jgi:hypothetical protein